MSVNWPKVASDLCAAFHAGYRVPVAYAMGLVAAVGFTSRSEMFPTHDLKSMPYCVDE